MSMPHHPRRRGTRVTCAIACATSLVWLAGCVNSERPAPPGAGATVSYGGAAPTAEVAGPHNQADVSFLEQAVPLRQQAIAIARLAGTNSSEDSLRSLAKQITVNEQPSLTDAVELLRRWGQPVPTSVRPSPDPVTSAQLRQLATARGAEFDRQWAHDIGRTLTRSLAITGTEQADGAYPPVQAVAVQWATELRDEQQKLSALVTGSGT